MTRQIQHLIVTGCLMLLIMCLPGCHGGKADALRQIYALDSAAIAQLSPERQLELSPQLDTLLMAGTAVADTAVLDLSWSVVMYLSGEMKYSQLLTYDREITPLLEGLIEPEHEQKMRQDILIMEEITYESYSKMGLIDRLNQSLVHILARAKQFDCDYVQIRIYNTMGTMYIRKRNFSKGMECIKQSIDLCKTIDNDYHLCGSYSNLAWAYMEMGNLDKAIEQGMVALNNAQDSALMMKCHSNLCTYYTKMGAYDLAAKQVLTAIDWYERNGINSELALDYSKYADVLWHTGHNAQAREYYERAYSLREQTDVNNRLSLAKHYATFCDSTGDIMMAKQLLQYCFMVSDSINRGNRDGDVLTKFFEEELLKNDETAQRYADSERRLIYWIIVLVLGFIAMASGLAWFIKRLMHRNYDMRHQLTDMEATLTKSTIENAHTQAVLTDLTGQLHELQKTINSGVGQREAMASVRQMTSQVMRASDEATSDALNVAHADFYKRLLERWPRLTNNDLRLCVLLRQGMSTKDIAELLCKEVRTVEAARNRLRKKLGLTDRNDDVTKFLMQV